MKHSGIFVTEKELDQVKTAQKCSGMFLSGGIPMGNPTERVASLCKKYNVPKGFGLDTETGEFLSDE